MNKINERSSSAWNAKAYARVGEYVPLLALLPLPCAKLVLPGGRTGDYAE